MASLIVGRLWEIQNKIQKIFLSPESSDKRESKTNKNNPQSPQFCLKKMNRQASLAAAGTSTENVIIHCHQT